MQMLGNSRLFSNGRFRIEFGPLVFSIGTAYGSHYTVLVLCLGSATITPADHAEAEESQKS